MKEPLAPWDAVTRMIPITIRIVLKTIPAKGFCQR